MAPPPGTESARCRGGIAGKRLLRGDEWDRVLGVNLHGTYLTARAFYPAMRDHGWGRVITIASQLAYKGSAGLAHYCASKAGVVGFTRALALEAAPHGVLVNSIAPGPVDTALLRGHSDGWLAAKRASLPLGRVGEVDEIAPTALLLASAAGDDYRGQTLSRTGATYCCERSAAPGRRASSRADPHRPSTSCAARA